MEKNSRNVVHIGGSHGLGKVKRNDISRQTPDRDAFKDATNSSIIVNTPYSLAYLTKVVQESSVVQQCIDAMVINVASNGYGIAPTDPTKTLDEVDPVELDTLHSYIEYANPNQSLADLMCLLKSDYETYGYSYREVIRSRNGKVSGFRHAPAYNIRLLKDSEGYIPVTKTINRGGRRTTIREFRLFRRYIQEISSINDTKTTLGKGSNRVYFKEFGDPRRMNYKNGRYQTDDYPVSDADLATEILHEKMISPDAYGIPTYASALPAILGAREAEEVNLNYFEDNTMPPAMITVSGGRLTKTSFEELDDLLTKGGYGKDRQHKMILVEALAESSGLEEGKTVSINVERLTDTRQSDGLFSDYEEAAAKKIRSLYRIPEAVLGIGGSNFANANSSIHIAETQVFQPSRNMHDNFWNLNIINSPEGLGLKTVKLQSKSMQVTESGEIVKAVSTLTVSGAITPRKATKVAKNDLGMDIDQYPEAGEDGYEDWMDKPLSLTVRSNRENLTEVEPRESEASPEAKDKVQGETGVTPDPENSEK